MTTRTTARSFGRVLCAWTTLRLARLGMELAIACNLIAPWMHGSIGIASIRLVWTSLTLTTTIGHQHEAATAGGAQA